MMPAMAFAGAPAPVSAARRAANGFTLVETLVALVLGSLLMAGLAAFVATLGTQWRTARAEAADREARARLAATLDRLLGDAVASAAGEPRFAGTEDTLRMTIVAPAALAAARLDRDGLVDISLFRAGTELRVAAASPTVRLPEAVLAGEITALSFAYAAATETGLVWQSRWPASGTVPRLARVTVRYREGEPVVVVAAARRTVDPRCQFDPVSLACRP